MSGIAGIITLKTSQGNDTVGLVERMSNLLHHRGPDDCGLYRSPGDKLVLANRRLAILDLSDDAQMPMPNERGDIWLSFNGEIYNFRELRHSLGLAGHAFRSAGDSEVIVHAYEQYGLDFLQHLRGMFAIALWDDRLGRLVLARDRLGKKPLYYTQHGDFLAFASEIKALTAAVPFRRRLEPWALSQYLSYGFVMPPLTMFEGVYKLAAGEALIVERGGPPERRTWWRPGRDGRKAAIIRGLTADQHVANLRTLLESSVADRLVSDVPFGALLDDRLASRCVVAIMCRLISRPVEAIGVVDPQAQGHEPPLRVIARRLGARYHEVTVTASQALGYLPDYARHLDEPIGDSHAMRSWWSARFCRDNGLSVALVGEGAEATLPEGPAYVGLRRRALARRVLERMAARLRPSPKPPEPPRPHDHLRGGWAGSNAFLGAETVFGEPEKWVLLGQAMRDLLRGRAAHAEASRVLGEMPTWLGEDSLACASYFELRMRLAEKQLMRLDKMAMAHGVEMRCPFLDDQLVDYLLAIPGEVRTVGRWSSPLLSQAVSDLIPPPSAKTQGGAPIGFGDASAVAGAFEEILGKSRLFEDGVLDQRRCQHLLREYREGRPAPEKLWNLLLLAEWYDLFWVEGPAAETTTAARGAIRLGRRQAAG